MLEPKTRKQNSKQSIKKGKKESDGQYDKMVTALKTAGLTANMIQIIKNQIQTLKEKTLDEETATTLPDYLNEKKLRKLKDKYKHIIFSPLDKNGGCMHMCCPIAYLNAMKKTYRKDKDHYTQLNQEPEDIMKDYRQFYEETTEQITKVDNMNKFEPTNLPYSYILFKNKDIKKIRPIVSYATHPLKHVLNITCRALNHMIQTINKDHALHCNMETCIELKDRIKDFETRMKDLYGKRTRFAFFMGDVKTCTVNSNTIQ